MLSEAEGRDLLRLARRALESHFGVAGEAVATEIRTPEGIGGVFATLTREGELRGCIGYVVPSIELPSIAERAVVAAATKDPRFSAVTVEELADIRIAISVLTESVPVHDVDEIQVGLHGLVIERGGARGLLLPQVASERSWDRDRLLAETCIKAGLPPESWKDSSTTIWRFAAVLFEEA
jgi:AmmeMemoRadiSam system protein A